MERKVRVFERITLTDRGFRPTLGFLVIMTFNKGTVYYTLIALLKSMLE